MIPFPFGFLAGLSTVGLILLCWLFNPALAEDRLRICLSSFTPINAAIWIAEDKGLFIAMSVTLAIAADRLRICLSSFTPINAAIWIAEDKGLFKKHGIDPEVIVVGGASAGGVSSLIAGDIQFLTGGGGAVINAALNGADVVMVASIVDKGVKRVMARDDLKRPEDLEGKRIGVTR